jgi:nucleotide-binding universal stress UspA family protein
MYFTEKFYWIAEYGRDRKGYEARMSFKTILVHVDLGRRRAQRLDAAFYLAEEFDAHLVALFALERLHIPSSAAAEAGLELERIALQLREREAEQAREQFDEKARKEQHEKCEWRQSLTQDALGVMRWNGRYADLIVAGQPHKDDPGGLPAGFSQELVMSAGRPVLLIPYEGRRDRIGQRVLVAWNGSQEAARAVKDGVPLLSSADEVEVVIYDRRKVLPDPGDLPDPDIAAYLARHGAKVTLSEEDSRGEDAGELILERARAIRADVVVMGAYSHSRVRELVLGGATRTVFRSMDVPVLMSR